MKDGGRVSLDRCVHENRCRGGDEVTAMALFLAKTDPESYSIDDLKREGKTEWNGVRNPAAVNTIKRMKPGDTVIIYHSQRDAAVVGLARVISSPRPDKNDPRSRVVDVEYVRHARRAITLREIKE